MKKRSVAVLLVFCFSYMPVKKKPVVVWQPSHQTDTGVNFSEAEVSNAIAEAAMAADPSFEEYKVWSHGRTDVHDANNGSNTVVAHTTAVIDGKISGYAWELQQSNKHKPDVFIALHNNGGSKRHAIWGYIHYGDTYEAENRSLAAALVSAVASVTNLENRGVLLDSTTGRNDYKCASTGKLTFYSLDENVNSAPYRVLLEIGDNKESYDFLRDKDNQVKMGRAIKKALGEWLARKEK
ncbi:hypothetical protein GWC95_00075 [Sediminibacterium roseum]|uniref:MurNAc-LAA domain-containing protein n=1 Tax=Sediminibacterium roseum TaxID=1978412 RepID=A0ABW9ZMI5_9BACT|nr:N-acetylmuramoyl-L-alanine amidase [Sediminibacterium roseum]NCI48295.1 hypothetical protein [Sediminibacterium roseum]